LSADFRLFLLLILLPLTSCLVGAEEAPRFPTYNQGEATFPCDVTIPPVFSGTMNYGIVAAGDTLYHFELRHGRIHGKTPIGAQITALASGAGSEAFVTCGNTLVRIDGFLAADSCVLPYPAADISMCGANPVLLLKDGSIALYSHQDLSLLGSSPPSRSAISCIQGFPDMVSAGTTDGTLITYSVPSFSLLAEETFSGSVLFVNDGGDKSLIFSTDEWNEVALCSPADLKVSVMFTFPEAPIFASADSAVSCIYAACATAGIQVCSANGEIAWQTTEFGGYAFPVVSEDCEIALVSWGRNVTILVK